MLLPPPIYLTNELEQLKIQNQELLKSNKELKEQIKDLLKNQKSSCDEVFRDITLSMTNNCVSN
ncbi:hypothetical protein [Campylobacter sp.]